MKLFAHTKFVVTSAATVTATAPAQLSAATANAIFAAGTSEAHVTVTFAGHVMVGATLSRTCMVCVHVDELPHTSVAIYVRVIRKLFAHTKFVVTSAATVTATAPAQLSAATTNPIFAAGTSAAHVTVTFAGHVIVGATLSRTCIL